MSMAVRCLALGMGWRALMSLTSAANANAQHHASCYIHRGYPCVVVSFAVLSDCRNDRRFDHDHLSSKLVPGLLFSGPLL